MTGIVRRWAILTHRYLGIALCVLFFCWFVSGIAMIYARGMPELAAATRLDRMPVLNVATVQVTPLDAARRAGQPQPERVTLLTVMSRPAYRVESATPVTIFADSGERLDHLTVDQALAIACDFTALSAPAARHVAVLTEPDQWTLVQRRVMPLHKVVFGDSASTEVYVSEPLGEVVMRTTRASRASAWFSAIPHWLYFATLRRHSALWTVAVLSVSGLGILAAMLGTLLAILQYRVRYRGFMRWHYWLGVVFGAFTWTWVFSGFLSMQPGSWASTVVPASLVEHGLPEPSLDLARFPVVSAAGWTAGRWVRELEFAQIEDAPVYIARGPNRSAVIAANPPYAPRLPVSVDAVIQRIKALVPPIPVTDATMLSTYDAYYYERDGALPLPVLRLRFADRDRTWVYVDLQRNRLVRAFSRRARLERWLYHGLHSLDFPFLYYRRPLWDVVVIGLSIGGALLSATAIVIGFRRVFQ